MKLYYSLILMFFALGAFSQRMNFEGLIRPVYNIPSALIIQQEGFSDYTMTARYNSKPFKLPPYYDFRLSYWLTDTVSIGLKFTHHKIILENPNEVVPAFSITHGYNLLTVYAARKIVFLKGSLLDIGFGAIIGHPEGQIRDKQIDQSWGAGRVWLSTFRRSIGNSPYKTVDTYGVVICSLRDKRNIRICPSEI